MRSLGLVLLIVLGGCVSSGDISPEVAQRVVEEETTGFKPYRSKAGAIYAMAASRRQVEGATILLVKGTAASPRVADIDAATTQVTLAAREYAAAQICQGGTVEGLEPARAGGPYDINLDGWGYKVRCSS